MGKLWILLSAAQPDYSTTVSLICFPILFVLAIIWWVRKKRFIDEMEGIWYCAELKMQISLTDPDNAFVMENGERIQCRSEVSTTQYKIGYLLVLCRVCNHPGYKQGQTLLAADINRYSEMRMVVRDRKKRREYTFVRTDKMG